MSLSPDTKIIKSGDIICKVYPCDRMNTWIDNINTIAADLHRSTIHINPEESVFITAKKTNEIVNALNSLVVTAKVTPKVTFDEQGLPQEEYRDVDTEAQEDYHTVEKDKDIIKASFFDALRRQLNALIEWDNWYTE